MRIEIDEFNPIHSLGFCVVSLGRYDGHGSCTLWWHSVYEEKSIGTYGDLLVTTLSNRCGFFAQAAYERRVFDDSIFSSCQYKRAEVLPGGLRRDAATGTGLLASRDGDHAANGKD